MVSLGDWVELYAVQDSTGPIYVQRSHIAFSPKVNRVELNQKLIDDSRGRNSVRCHLVVVPDPMIGWNGISHPRTFNLKHTNIKKPYISTVCK